MTDVKATLERARDSVRNALGILSSADSPWPMKGLVHLELLGAEKLLSAAIAEESKK